MMPFIGRERELKLLKDLLRQKKASLVVIKGRRRIGKSRLVEEFAKNYRFISLAGLAPTEKITEQDQRDEFAQSLSRIFNMPPPNSSNWGDLFWHLAEQIKTGRAIILLDELSWMAMKDATFLAKLKTAWDLHFKKNSELILILCSSVSTWIEKNVLSSSGFVGRIDLTLTLKELFLFECNLFWGNRKDQTSAYEKFKILSTTGGVPRYLESITPEDSAEANIKRLFFIKEGFLFNEFDRLFHDLFGKRSDVYKNILIKLIERPQATLQEIFSDLEIKKSGTIVLYLEDLIEAGFVQRHYTWSIRTDKISDLSQFRVSDNYIRFYLKYVLPNKLKIEADHFNDRSLTLLSGWETIMGFQFENLVLGNRKAIQKILRIDINEIIFDNPYFQKKTTTKPGCQIDYLIQTRFNCLYPCEIKFCKKPLKKDIIDEMEEKIKKLLIPKNFSYRPVLIHVNGVEEEVMEAGYFSDIIDFGQLFA